MTTTDHTAIVVARALLDAGCVTVRTDEPFRLPSGWASPMYMNCRRLTAFPTLRRNLVAQAVQQLRNSGCLDGLAGIVGGESSGIALAAWIAEELDLPMHYVRKRGGGAHPVEGALSRGDRVLLVDDLMAAAYSKVRFIETIRTAGADLTDLFVIFDYGTFPTGRLLTSHGVRSHAMATWHDVATVAHEQRLLPVDVLAEIDRFLAAPASWSLAHGGRAEPSFSKEANP